MHTHVSYKSFQKEIPILKEEPSIILNTQLKKDMTQLAFIQLIHYSVV